MTPQQVKLTINLVSLFIALASGILAVGQQMSGIPGLPGWLTTAWPVVTISAMAIDRIGNIIVDYLKGQQPPVPAPPLTVASPVIGK